MYKVFQYNVRYINLRYVGIIAVAILVYYWCVVKFHSHTCKDRLIITSYSYARITCLNCFLLHNGHVLLCNLHVIKRTAVILVTNDFLTW